MPILDRLPALGHRDFRNFILGSLVSNVGGNVQMWAVSWHVYHLTGNSFMVGLVAGIRVIPLLIFSLIGGAFADTHDRRTTILICQVVMAVIAGCISVLTFTGHGTVWVLIGLVTLSVVPMAFNNPARQAMLANLVPREHFPNAASVNGIQWRLSDILGPALAGLFIGLHKDPMYGLSLCYLINSITFLAIIYTVWLLPKTPLPPERERMTVPKVIGLIKEGWNFVWKKPILRDTMTLDFCATFLSGAEALLPAFAKMLGLGAIGYGLLASATGMGALLAASVLAWMPPIRYQGRTVLMMIGLFGLFTVGFGLSPNLPTAMFFLAGIGASDMISTVLRQTIRQLSTPDDVRGRMSAVSMVFNITGPRLGDLEAGLVAKLLTERLSIITGGLGCLVVAAVYSLRAKELRAYEHEG